LGYPPVKLPFKPYEIDEKNKSESQETKVREDPLKMIKTLQATIESNIDMWKFINDKYNFSDEKIRDCLSTNTV